MVLVGVVVALVLVDGVGIGGCCWYWWMLLVLVVVLVLVDVVGIGGCCWWYCWC